jgi:hypothetical protein
MHKLLFSSLFTVGLGASTAGAAIVWQVGMDDNGWPVGDGGGPNATFVQEQGVINPLPGVANSPEIAQQADNDYYFAGIYSTQVDGGPAYVPLGIVGANEEAAERAFAGGDLSLRYHFNLTGVNASDLFSVTFDANNLDGTTQPDITLRNFGVQVWFNGVMVMPEVRIYEAGSGQAAWTPGASVALLDDDITTSMFTLASVNAQIGVGFDNYVELRGISHNGDAPSGGNWMGIDYVQLNANPVPEPSSALFVLVSALISVPFIRRRR